MAELQIKAESLPTRCEICHKSDCFTPENGYCSRCSVVYLIKQACDQEYSNLPQPTNITIIDYGDRLEIILRWFFISSAVARIFISFCLLFIIVFLITNIPGQSDRLLSIFLEIGSLALFGILIFAVYRVLQICLNRTYIQITKGEILVHTTPILNSQIRFQTDEITQLYCKEKLKTVEDGKSEIE